MQISLRSTHVDRLLSAFWKEKTIRCWNSIRRCAFRFRTERLFLLFFLASHDYKRNLCILHEQKLLLWDSVLIHMWIHMCLGERYYNKHCKSTLKILWIFRIIYWWGMWTHFLAIILLPIVFLANAIIQLISDVNLVVVSVVLFLLLYLYDLI